MRSRHFIIAAALFGVGPAGAALAQTVTFRNGENGYSGTVDRRMGAKAANHTNGADVDTDTTPFFVDGGGRDPAQPATDVTDGLIRFDNIVGPGAIPSNALIINATLDLRTTTSTVNGNSQSGGAYSVYGLTSPFDQTTTWNDATFGGDGTVGNTGRPGAYFSKPAAGEPTQARVDRIVQDWVKGGANHGFAIRSNDTGDGWSFNTTGAATVANRPGLTVNYTTHPDAKEYRYQQNVDGYTGSRDSFINGFSGATRGVAVDGAFRELGYLDGDNGNDSYDQPYLLKFNNVDVNLPSITKAELTISTGPSGNSDTGGPWTVHRVLKPWDDTTTYASLDSDGDNALNAKDELIANGFIAPESANVGYVPDAGQVIFDITDIAQAWKDGEANYGIYIGPGTANGWQIFTTGAGDPSLAPELRLLYAPASPVPEPAALGVLAVGGMLILRRRRRQAH